MPRVLVAGPRYEQIGGDHLGGAFQRNEFKGRGKEADMKNTHNIPEFGDSLGFGVFPRTVDASVAPISFVK